jgi:hypothetical protein
MKKTTGAIHQEEGNNPTVDFIRDNELAAEMDSGSVITSRGEQLLNELQGPTRQSSTDLPGVSPK